MIQDIFPYEFHNGYTPQPPDADSFILWYDSSCVLLCKQADGVISFPRFADLLQEPAQWIYLFSIGDDRFYWLNQRQQPVGEPFAMESIYTLRHLQPRHYAYAGLVGFSCITGITVTVIAAAAVLHCSRTAKNG